MEPGYLAGGLIVGLLFAGLLVFKIFPEADHVVKKEFGIYEAMFITRFGALCVALPLYVFTMLMMTVIVFHSDKANSMIEQICPDDYSCTQAFAMGRQNFDKGACKSIDCSDAELDARSGSTPKKFPEYGLGTDMDPVRTTDAYSCVFGSDSSYVCENEAKEACTCADSKFSTDLGICLKLVGCFDDIEETTHTVTCSNTNDDNFCQQWHVETDSAKQFGFQDCSCTEFSGGVCTAFGCNELRMNYYYPNVFFAGLTTIGFIFPIMYVWYTTLKTQLRKVLKCVDAPIFVYSQEAGAINEDTAENLATGGYTNEEQQKAKYRTCTAKDIVVLIGAPLLEMFFGWLVIETSGRVGAGFIGLSGGVIAVIEIYKWYSIKKKMNERLKERIENNTDQGVNNF